MSASYFTPDRIAAYCALRLPSHLDTDACVVLGRAFEAYSDQAVPLPVRNGRILYSALSLRSGLDVRHLRRAHAAIQPLVAAMARTRSQPPREKKTSLAKPKRPKTMAVSASPDSGIVLPPGFGPALAKLFALHGDSAWRVAWALRDQGLPISGGTLKAWATERTRPGRRHWPHLRAIAMRYGLPEDSLITQLSSQPSIGADVLASVPKAIRQDLAWHLPSDYAQRPPETQAEIRDWITRTFGSGSTDYRRYLQDRLQTPYALPLRAGDGMTPPRLLEEVEALLAFKTAAFVPIGQERNGVWNAETAAQKRVQLGQMFGALSDLGIKPHALSLALVVLPSVWDAWLRWREASRLLRRRRSRSPAHGPGPGPAQYGLAAAIARTGAAPACRQRPGPSRRDRRSAKRLGRRL